MTIKIERMELDEAGGDPAKIAAAVVAQVRDLAPPIPVEDIAYGADITEIQRIDLTGYEGGLITWDDKFEGRILVNGRSMFKRQRYTIGHELGHFLNPWHQPPSEEGFRCTAKDMVRTEARPGDRAAEMEVEANIFAAELLLPPMLFLRDLRRRAGLDLEHILDLAARYDVSKEATGRRYVALQDEPLRDHLLAQRNCPLLPSKPRFPFSRRTVWPAGARAVTSRPTRRSRGGRVGLGRRRWRHLVVPAPRPTRLRTNARAARGIPHHAADARRR